MSIASYMDSKPREERDLTEIYPDLDETKQLHLFVVTKDSNSVEEYEDRIKSSQPIVGTLNEPVFERILPELETAEETHFNKHVSEYGYHDPKSKKPSKAKSTYIKPFQTENSETIQEVIKRRKKQSEYDMDEQDLLYLQHRNNLSENLLKLTPEVFEILITILENEWTDLENQMNSLTNEDDTTAVSLNLDKGIDNNKYGNDDGIVFGTVDDQKCAVCNDSDCDNSNAIVFCDGCNIAVHQECYGVAFIPEGLWLCRKCMINKHRQFDCCFCPSKTGAFKQLDNSLWSHVVCALWINELYFANPIYMEPIEGIDMIPKSRWRLNCYICKQKVGACIQCFNRNCFQAYHVTCAKRAQLCMQMTKGVQGAVKNKLTLRSYCDKHTPIEYALDQQDIIESINKTRLYFRDLNLLNLKKDKLTKHKQLSNKLNMFKWKTEKNTPIAPKKFSESLFNKLLELKLDSMEDKGQGMLRGLGFKPVATKQAYFKELEKISNQVCKYWCLKRESKNGAPLIRKNNNLVSTSSILYGNNSIQEIQNKIEFSKILIDDLGKVILLSELNLKRQWAQQDMHDNDEELIRRVYFPRQQLIKTILQDLLHKYDGKKVLVNWQSKRSPHSLRRLLSLNDYFQIENMEQLHFQLQELDGLIKAENKLTNNVVRVSSKVLTKFEERLDDYLAIEKNLALDKSALPIKFEKETVQLVDELGEWSDLSEVEDMDGELQI